MTALANLTAELNRINGSEAVTDCQAQLARVQARIADCLKSRATCEARGYSQTAWREVNQRLHRLYVLEGDIKRDLAQAKAA